MSGGLGGESADSSSLLIASETDVVKDGMEWISRLGEQLVVRVALAAGGVALPISGLEEFNSLDGVWEDGGGGGGPFLRNAKFCAASIIQDSFRPIRFPSCRMGTSCRFSAIRSVVVT